jgi:hypothetical protein
MTRAFTLSAVFLLFGAVPLQAASPPSLTYGEVSCKLLAGPDKDGDMDISVKVTVSSSSENDLDVKVTVRALDSEDFEVFETYLEEIVPAGGTKVLTDTDFISERIYKTIVRWEIEED